MARQTPVAIHACTSASTALTGSLRWAGPALGRIVLVRRAQPRTVDLGAVRIRIDRRARSGDTLGAVSGQHPHRLVRQRGEVLV